MFSNAISLDFFHNDLKGRIHQLDPAEVDDVSQAGKGSYLLVMGKLPADSPSNFFTIPPIGNPYLLDETYVIKDLDSNFNISRQFLFDYIIQQNLRQGRLMFPYPAGQPLIVADCHTPSSTGSICSLIRSNVPGKFICLNPRKSAIVDSVKHVGSVRGDYAFSSRPPMSSVKPNFDPHFKTAPGTTEVPWDVAELPQAHEPSKFSIQNLMTKPRTLKWGNLLGSLCELTLP